VVIVGDIIRLLASSAADSQRPGYLGLMVEAEVIDRYAQLSCQCPSVPRGGSTGSLLPGSQRLVRDADSSAQGRHGEGGRDYLGSLLPDGTDSVHQLTGCQGCATHELETSVTTTGASARLTELLNSDVRKSSGEQRRGARPQLVAAR
jgi:hypothetical protein